MVIIQTVVRPTKPWLLGRCGEGILTCSVRGAFQQDIKLMTPLYGPDTHKVLFRSNMDPLSNMYKCEISYKNINFNSSNILINLNKLLLDKQVDSSLKFPII